jgi:hypothetical protein
VKLTSQAPPTAKFCCPLSMLMPAGLATKPPAAVFKAHCAALAGATGTATGALPATHAKLGVPEAKVVAKLSTAWTLVAIAEPVFLITTLYGTSKLNGPDLTAAVLTDLMMSIAWTSSVRVAHPALGRAVLLVFKAAGVQVVGSTGASTVPPLMPTLTLLVTNPAAEAASGLTLMVKGAAVPPPMAMVPV